MKKMQLISWKEQPIGALVGAGSLDLIKNAGYPMDRMAN